MLILYPSEISSLVDMNVFSNQQDAIRIVHDRSFGKKQRAKRPNTQQKCGVDAEKKLVEAGVLKDNNTPVSRKLYFENGNVILLRGKVDGLDENGCPVETKRRVHGTLLKTVLEHDRVQMHVYMYILKKTTARFIETVENGESYVCNVVWEEAFWATIVDKLQTILQQI
jgi:hypothetical protein